MKHYILNFTGVKTYFEFHQNIQYSLDFTEGYGMNLDAFWDCITDIDAPCTLHIIGTASLPKDLQEYLQNDIIRLLTRAKKWFTDIDMEFHFIIE